MGFCRSALWRPIRPGFRPISIISCKRSSIEPGPGVMPTLVFDTGKQKRRASRARLFGNYQTRRPIVYFASLKLNR